LVFISDGSLRWQPQDTMMFANKELTCHAWVIQ
jgi:hypothetical protein